jgi:glutamate/aspartate transport system substrate-binding protein
LTALTILLSGGSSWAEAPVSTLKRIAETGVIRIGYSVEDIPFSYRTADGKVLGYSTDLCLRVADALKAKLGLSEIKVEYVERTPRNRVAMLRDGDFDIECVASTNNAERRKSVGFTHSHFVTGTQFVSLKANNLKTIGDLAGHTVVATSGTTNIGQLNAVNRERGLHIAVMPVENHKTAFRMVAEGRASAFVMDGVLLAAMVASSEQPDIFALSSDSLGYPEPYGLMVRRDDQDFKNAVNAALEDVYKSGEIETIYDKWFNQPVPPNGINMRLPISAELRKAFANPSAEVQ